MYRRPAQTPAVTLNKHNNFVDGNNVRVHGKWKSQQVQNTGRLKKPNLVPEKLRHSIKPLNLLSEMNNESSVHYETEAKIDAIEQKYNDTISVIQISRNQVMSCVISHYENLIKKQNELLANEKLSLQLRNVDTSIVSNDYTLLSVSTKETTQLLEAINLALAKHTIMVASKCLIVVDTALQNSNEYPTLFVRWRVFSKPIEVCKYTLEQKPYDEDNKDEVGWRQIKEIQIGTQEVSGAFVFASEDKDNPFKWGKIYMLRIRGCCASNIVYTPYSSIITTYITTSFIDSPIIKNEYISQLLEWLPKGKNHTFNLLYRGSKHGYTACEFHLNCNKKGPTLVIVETKEKSIFGGFTKAEWYSRKRGQPPGDEEAFVFSLKTADVLTPQKFAINIDDKACAIKGQCNFGPCFGNGDIIINDKCNEVDNSSKLCTYNKHNRTTLAEKEIFTVREIEVYSVQ